MDNASFMRIMSYNPLLDPLISKLDLKQSWKASNGTFRHSCRGSAELALTTLKNTGNMVLLFSKDKAKYNCAGRCRRGQWKILNTQRDSAEVDVSVSTLGDHSFSSAQKREGQSDKKEESLSTRESVYLFQTEGGGQVKVVVSSMDTRYKVNIEVLSLPQGFSNFEHDLRLHWGLFRSNSSHWVILDSESAPEGTTFVTGNEQDFMQTPFEQGSVGSHTLDLTFDSNRGPFFIAFVLYGPTDFWIRTHLGKNFCVPVGFGRGNPDPLGFSLGSDGTANFALYSRNAENVVLCLYDSISTEPSLEIDLDPYMNRTGDIWHILLETLGEYTRYGYRCRGDISWDKGDRFHARRILLDPYSKFLAPFISGQDNLVSPTTCLGSLIEEPPFEWEEDSHPRLPLESLVVYRLNVGGFTADKSSGLQEDMRGTFLGLIGKLYHLKNLGVNAVMLEPIFAFDRRQGPFYPYNFFAPMDCYGPFGDGISASNSLKEMIKAFHKNGIEVILEVVYTHTAEKGDSAPETISFRGIDNSSYYIVDENNEVTAPETGNLFNCNHPTVQRMILDSLQHWVNEYHIDGFCFSNSSSLIRGPHGENLSRPPLIEAIAFDPILSKTKIIADPCLPIKASCKEIPFPHWKRWAELNIRFHDDVRSFLKGDKCQLSNFATRLCGSGDLFTDGRGPSFSFNFITSNFGLSLVDLVSFSDAEMTSTELSWNCGVEGPTSNPLVLETRLKQIRNFLFILFVSLGVPVLNMGDEYGHTKGGSVLLKDRKPFNWDALKSEFGVQTTRFIGYLSSLRLRRRDLLQRRNFVKIENLNWHGPYPKQPMWEDLSSSFLAVSLKPEENESESGSAANDLYIAFNSQQGPVIATLPQLSDGILWHRLVDTSLPFPETFLVEGATSDLSGVRFSTYEVKPYCCVLFEARMTS
eukprot:Gb_23290 [translate_table: standard]